MGLTKWKDRKRKG